MEKDEMTSKQIKELRDTFLFRGLYEETVERILMNPGSTMKKYRKGEIIFRPDEYSRSLGYIVSGTCKVTMDQKGSGKLPMTILSKGSFFGVAALFNEDVRYVTSVEAVKSTSILFMDQQLVMECIEKVPGFAMNYIRFMGNRIRFLNRKIEILAKGNSEKSLAGFLLSSYTAHGMEFTLPTSCSELARALNISRSSLYRALEDLENRKIMSREGRKIRILDPDSLGDIDI
jgi:CRP/FNR family transcriptional regulator